MKTVIHVNRQHIVQNRKDGGNRPVFTVKDYKQNRKGNRVVCHGPVEFVSDKPLSCGARAYAITTGKVDVE